MIKLSTINELKLILVLVRWRDLRCFCLSSDHHARSDTRRQEGCAGHVGTSRRQPQAFRCSPLHQVSNTASSICWIEHIRHLHSLSLDFTYAP